MTRRINASLKLLEAIRTPIRGRACGKATDVLNKRPIAIFLSYGTYKWIKYRENHCAR